MTHWLGRGRPLCVAVLMLVPASPLAAQSLTSGVLAGYVEAEDGTPLYDARVQVTDNMTGIGRTARTERDGRYRLLFLRPAEYTVLVERLGYQPKRVEGVRVSAGGRSTVTTSMARAEPPIEVAVERWGDRLDPVGPGIRRRIDRSRLESLPASRREVTEAGRLFSASTATLESEGLPSRYSALVVDGIPVSTPAHPDVPFESLRAAAFPIGMFAEVELITEPTDVEQGVWSGAHLLAQTRAGTRALASDVFGTWSGQPLAASRHFDASALAHNSLAGGVTVSGPVVTDTAVFNLGVEALRLESLLPPSWVRTPLDSELIQTAWDFYGVDIHPYAEPRLHRSQAIAGSGRFDWQISGATGLDVRGSLAELPRTHPDPAATLAAGLGPTVTGRDMWGAATLMTQFTDRRGMEVRVSYATSSRDYDSDLARRVPDTRFVDGGIALGIDAASPGRFEHAAFAVSQALVLRTEAHALKFGAVGALPSYGQTYARGREGAFLFADAAAFSEGVGAFVQATGGAPLARFGVPRFGVFLQDGWQAAPGVDITTGIRVDVERWPADQIRANQAWFDRTGLSNASLPERQTLVSPRLGLSWDVQEAGRWRLDVAAGIHPHAADPAILAELLTHDGRVEVRRGVGLIDSWPAAPSPGAAPVAGARLSLPGPAFASPRTYRAAAAVTHLLRGRTSVSVVGAARRTDLLPRRADLNLLPMPSSVDQFGRPLYGAAWRDGGLMVAQPGSNRRFQDFDLVSAINADGVSDYLGMTLAAERWEDSGPFGFLASYTYSRTTDNWLGARSGGLEAQLHPFPHAQGADWANGRSDFDLPHRLVAVGELRPSLPLRPRLAAVYRYRSGYPFTPGFRDGVDINGDGSGRNDPAFVNEFATGIVPLLESWDCLQAQAGRFADRNSCREPGAHSFDARVSLRVLRSRRYSAELVVDALNLLESDVGRFDHALFLVDPSRDLTLEPSGALNIPLIVNPGFGRLLARESSGRLLRVGFRMTY